MRLRLITPVPQASAIVTEMRFVFAGSVRSMPVPSEKTSRTVGRTVPGVVTYGAALSSQTTRPVRCKSHVIVKSVVRMVKVRSR